MAYIGRSFIWQEHLYVNLFPQCDVWCDLVRLSAQLRAFAIYDVITFTKTRGVTFDGSGGMAGRRGYLNNPGKGRARLGLQSQMAYEAITEGTEEGAIGGASLWTS